MKKLVLCLFLITHALFSNFDQLIQSLKNNSLTPQELIQQLPNSYDSKLTLSQKDDLLTAMTKFYEKFHLTADNYNDWRTASGKFLNLMQWLPISDIKKVFIVNTIQAFDVNSSNQELKTNFLLNFLAVLHVLDWPFSLDDVKIAAHTKNLESWKLVEFFCEKADRLYGNKEVIEALIKRGESLSNNDKRQALFKMIANQGIFNFTKEPKINLMSTIINGYTAATSSNLQEYYKSFFTYLLNNDLYLRLVPTNLPAALQKIYEFHNEVDAFSKSSDSLEQFKTKYDSLKNKLTPNQVQTLLTRQLPNNLTQENLEKIRYILKSNVITDKDFPIVNGITNSIWTNPTNQYLVSLLQDLLDYGFSPNLYSQPNGTPLQSALSKQNKAPFTIRVHVINTLLKKNAKPPEFSFSEFLTLCKNEIATNNNANKNGMLTAVQNFAKNKAHVSIDYFHSDGPTAIESFMRDVFEILEKNNVLNTSGLNPDYVNQIFNRMRKSTIVESLQTLNYNLLMLHNQVK